MEECAPRKTLLKRAAVSTFYSLSRQRENFPEKKTPVKSSNSTSPAPPYVDMSRRHMTALFCPLGHAAAVVMTHPSALDVHVLKADTKQKRNTCITKQGMRRASSRARRQPVHGCIPYVQTIARSTSRQDDHKKSTRKQRMRKSERALSMSTNGIHSSPITPSDSINIPAHRDHGASETLHTHPPHLPSTS